MPRQRHRHFFFYTYICLKKNVTMIFLHNTSGWEHLEICAILKMQSKAPHNGKQRPSRRIHREFPRKALIGRIVNSHCPVNDSDVHLCWYVRGRLRGNSKLRGRNKKKETDEGTRTEWRLKTGTLSYRFEANRAWMTSERRGHMAGD